MEVEVVPHAVRHGGALDSRSPPRPPADFPIFPTTEARSGKVGFFGGGGGNCGNINTGVLTDAV